MRFQNVPFFATLVLCAAVQISASTNKKPKCDYSEQSCQYGLNRQLAVQRLYTRILRRCPDPDGFNSNIGLLESGRNMKTLAESFVRSAEFEKKLNEGTNEEKDKIHVLFNVILGRKPTEKDVADHILILRGGYKNLATVLFNSEEYRLAFGDFNSVPGNPACDISCEMIDTITEAYCLILNRCPEEEAFKFMARRLGFNQATAKTIVQDLIKSDEFEKKHMKGKSLDQQISTIYELLLHRTPTKNEILGNMRTLQINLGGAGYKELADGLMNAAEYSSIFGDNKVPVKDFNGPDFIFENLPPSPFDAGK